jgi:hypothetical protein
MVIGRAMIAAGSAAASAGEYQSQPYVVILSAFDTASISNSVQP